MNTQTMYKICENQGKIWESAACHGYDMEAFFKAYMHSSFARSFDECWSLFHFMDTKEALQEFLEKAYAEGYAPSERSDGLFYSADVSYWAGFMCRFIAFSTGAKSADIGEEISFNELANAYPGLHTLSEEEALGDIVGAHPALGGTHERVV